MNTLSRCLILGASFGIISYAFGVSKSLFWGIGFGMLAGFFAALHVQKLQNRKNPPQKK